MFGPTSILGYTLIDFPVLLGEELGSRAFRIYWPWIGPTLSMRAFNWFESFCQWLAFSCTFVIIFCLVSGTFYGARACICKLRSGSATTQAMPVEVSMPESDNLLLPAKDGLRIQVRTDNGLEFKFYYFIKANGDRPLLHSYSSNETIENVSLIKDPSMLTSTKSWEGEPAPLGLWLRFRVYRGPEIKVAVIAMWREPGWLVLNQRVHPEWEVLL